jgi:hypothetical protein
MNFIITYIIKKIGITSFMIVVESLYVASVVAFFIFIIQAISFLRTMIQSLLDYMSSGSSSVSSVDLTYMYGYLNVIGFFDALVTAWPFIESAISFLLMRFLWKFTLNAYQRFVTSISHIAETI